MSDAGNIEESSVENENKINIEETIINLGCVKNEPSEEGFDFEVDNLSRQYRITLKYENIFGESSNQRKLTEDYDNLIGFLDNDVIMENAMIKLDAIKEEYDGSFSNFHCSKCRGIYKGYCLNCSTLSHILNNKSIIVKSELNTIPADILEIRETTRGKGVYLLRTLPINIILGPFEGVVGIEGTIGHSWKIINNKFRNIESGNWMKNIVCAENVSLKNLDIFQIDSKLYFQTTREIREGEELLIYYNDGEWQQLENSEECLYTPQKQEKLPKIFACTVCCLGFGSNKCLMEHKRKSCRMEHSTSMKDFVLVECHYCKMWMEKWEHEEYHVAYCLEKHHRMWSDYSEAVDRSHKVVGKMADGGTTAGKRTYRRDICSRPYDRKVDLESDANDYQCFSGANHETRLNECLLAERSYNKQIQNYRNNHTYTVQCDICMKEYTKKDSLKKHIKNKHRENGCTKDYQCLECTYQTNFKGCFQAHLNTHRSIKQFKCDICMMKFTRDEHLKTHIRNKHTDDGSGKDYKCLECSFVTKYKSSLQRHLNTHKDIKPFKCDVCVKEFGQKVQLQTHIRNQHTGDGCAKDYKCSECSYEINYERNFHRHLIKHRGIKLFKCDICMTTFTWKQSLNRHIKYNHSDDGRAKD